MNRMGVRAALAFLLLFVATVEAAEGGVTFWKKDFTMVCPESGMWFNKLQEDIESNGNTLRYQYGGQNKGVYHCKYKDADKNQKKYYFYVKGKVCDNCYEVDAVVFGCTVVGDVVATACMMAIIYRWAKKKSAAGLAHASKAPARTGGRLPPPISPDYEPLSPHTRSQDPYSVVNRMG